MLAVLSKADRSPFANFTASSLAHSCFASDSNSGNVPTAVEIGGAKRCPKEKELLRVEQRAWLKYRDSCQGDIDPCLLQRMKDRWNKVAQ